MSCLLSSTVTSMLLVECRCTTVHYFYHWYFRSYISLCSDARKSPLFPNTPTFYRTQRNKGEKLLAFYTFLAWTPPWKYISMKFIFWGHKYIQASLLIKAYSFYGFSLLVPFKFQHPPPQQFLCLTFISSSIPILPSWVFLQDFLEYPAPHCSDLAMGLWPSDHRLIWLGFFVFLSSLYHFPLFWNHSLHLQIWFLIVST